MPYEIRTKGSQFCVVKSDTDEEVACHPTKEKATAQLRALYANEAGMKSWTEMKAAPLSSKELDRWMQGEISRRLLVVPFGGPLPGGKAGLDLDGEAFDEESDLYGPFPGLRNTRERIVDWHHDDFGVPEGKQWMKGSMLGRIVLDDEPSEFRDGESVYEGIAADWWANVGERRLALIRSLQKKGSPIFGSSQALKGAIRKSDLPGGGRHIDVWPLIRHTISTSPQNTFAVVPPLKAVLEADVDFSEVGVVALKAAIIGLDALTLSTDPGSSSPERASLVEGKAGRVLSAANEAELRRALEALAAVLAKLPAPDAAPEETPA